MPFGASKKPLVQVTPANGVDRTGVGQVGGNALQSVGNRLHLRLNDAVQIDEAEWDGDDKTLDIELKGRGKSTGDGLVRFREVATAADFEKCWAEVFSDIPMQRKYDGPEAIKQMVAERRVQNGMTREQVLIAVGNPEKVARTQENGRELEVWTVLTGDLGGWGVTNAANFQMSMVDIKFEEGKVVGFEQRGQETGVQLR